jgi:ankyrin repeat protein
LGGFSLKFPITVKDADVNAKAKDGVTTILTITKKGHTKIVNLLRQAEGRGSKGVIFEHLI